MSTNRKLRFIAAQLPPLPKMDKKGVMQKYKVSIKVSGAEVLKENPLAVVKEKEIETPVDPGKEYIQQQEFFQLYDHFTEMKEMYRDNGATGVNTYIQICFDYNKMTNPGLKF